MKEVMEFTHQVIGMTLTHDIDEGELSPSDDMAKEFFCTCFSNKACVNFVAHCIAQHFDVNVDDISEWMETLYSEGEELLRGDKDES